MRNIKLINFGTGVFQIDVPLEVKYEGKLYSVTSITKDYEDNEFRYYLDGPGWTLAKKTKHKPVKFLREVSETRWSKA